MKLVKFIAISAAVMALFSCTKHEIKYNTDPVDSSTMTEFQLHYFEPVVNSAANYIDSVFVNDVLYSSVNGSGQLLPYNGVPGGSAGRFFAVKSGDVKFTLYRKGNIIYDKTVNLPVGKVNIFIYDLTKAPVVLDNLEDQYRNRLNYGGQKYDTDSIATVRFFNFLYEGVTDGVPTPYPGRLQYQWKYNTETADAFRNLGNPVAFGEATDRVPVVVHKSVFNSSGYCRIDYRILDENGEIFTKFNGSKYINYSDYWTTYIGRAYNHIFRGFRTKSPYCDVTVWTSL